MPVFRWDNYVSIFLATETERVREAVFIQGAEGQKPVHPGVRYLTPWKLLREIEDVVNAGSPQVPWIVNVDLDYFTLQPDEDSRLPPQLFSTEFVTELGRAVLSGVRSGHVKCVTVALSPETTGDWRTAERLASEFLAHWNCGFGLPASGGDAE